MWPAWLIFVQNSAKQLLFFRSRTGGDGELLPANPLWQTHRRFEEDGREIQTRRQSANGNEEEVARI